MEEKEMLTHWGGLLDTDFELISGDPKYLYGPQDRVGSNRCQMTNGVLIQVYLTVGPVGPQAHLVVFLQFQNA